MAYFLRFVAIWSTAVLFFPVKCSAELQELTDDTFNDEVARKEITLVMFMAPWCGHCQKLHPVIQEVADNLTDHQWAGVYTIDCTSVGQKKCHYFSVSGYPTLKLFKRGHFWKDYDGGRTFEDIVSFLTDVSGPRPEMVADEESLERLVKDSVAYVGFFGEDTNDSRLMEVFMSIADEFRGQIKTGLSTDDEMIKRHCPQNGVVFVRMKAMRSKYEPNEIVYEGKPKRSALLEWMQQVKHGLVGVRTPGNQHEFKKPLIVAYYDVDFEYDAKTTKKLRNRVLQVAKRFKDNFNFAVSQKFDFPNDFFQFGFTSLPMGKAVVLATTAAGKFRMEGKLEVGNLEDFVVKLKKGKLTPFVRSAKAPERNDGVVKIVTANTFKELVVDSGRDSFLMLYSAKCSRSQMIQPVWRSVGKTMVGEDVDILMMEVLSNDRLPEYVLVGQVPTFYWVPKTNKTNPVFYSGEQELSDFVRYIAENASDELKSINREGKRTKSTKDEL
ncbi:Thioredoxin [Nesidiocoris tenuis]|uniref:protein disulfide-isomerase n=1 Tax=Nesidiocoris tenuis TaxID=355587 RepID=A0ABN7B2D4_9HEMI|nr:Thioredoxin [Nesidiocoris tenuis]